MISPLRVTVPLVALGILAGGCGQSEQARGEAALARLQHLPKPGYVRFINLSGSTLDVVDVVQKRHIAATIEDGNYGLLGPETTGPRRLRLNDADLSLDVPADGAVTIVTYPAYKTESFVGDERKPATDANVRIVVAKGDGSTAFPAKGIPIVGTESLSATKDGQRLQVPTGDYTVGGESFKLEDRCAYTFMFVPYKGKLRQFLMKNTQNQKPVGAGMSKS